MEIIGDLIKSLTIQVDIESFDKYIQIRPVFGITTL